MSRSSQERTIERHRSASLRAVGRDPSAELRRGALVSGGRLVPVASPYLALAVDDEAGQALAVSRGVADGLGLLLRFSDPVLHAEQQPEVPFERVVFDTLEQLRCQARWPGHPGLRANIDAAFQAWCSRARADGVAESGVGLLIYTVTHMVRTRLRMGFPDEEVDGIIEGTRATLAPVIGHALQELPRHIEDQAAFAVPAREVARLVAEVAGDAPDALVADGADRYRLLLPPGWLDDPTPHQTDADEGISAPASADDPMALLEALPGYHVYTVDHDAEATGESLYPASTRRQLRRQLDAQVSAQAVSAQRLALIFQRRFGVERTEDWEFGRDDGVIDGRRLAQLVAGPDNRQVFRQPREVTGADSVICFLMDNSGSMKVQRYQTMAVLIDTFSRALDLAGISNEVLGFSTGTWAGGRARQDWERAGRPADPGRLADVLQVVYKSADTPWRRARGSLASMMRPLHFREGVDGEAIIWAHKRLLARPESRKMLVVVSDGAPTETSTANSNRPGFLDDHLLSVVDHIEQRSPVELAAPTVDRDVSSLFRRSVPIDLNTTLTLDSYAALTSMFDPSP